MHKSCSSVEVDTLLSFFKAMYLWETEMDRLEQTCDWENTTEEELQQQDARMHNELVKIFEEYCLEGAEAQRVKDVMHWGSEEPQYDPAREKILSVTKTGESVLIETQQTHWFKAHCKYEMVKDGGKWKVKDNRKSKSGNKWENDPL